LIPPDSGKDKDEVKKENIRKFGFGLVSTHILSAEMKISGTNSASLEIYVGNKSRFNTSFRFASKLQYL
jgi:hypothetical protein